MNDDQKRAWKDAQRDYITEEAAKRIVISKGKWALFWTAVILGLGKYFFYVRVFDEKHD
jgi:hypothetical protein